MESDQPAPLSRLIHQDHRALRALLLRIMQPLSRTQVKADLSAFQHLLGAHNMAVEETLYETLKHHLIFNRQIEKAEASHLLLEDCTERLSQSLSRDDQTPLGLLALLQDMFESQIVIEEQSLVPTLMLMADVPESLSLASTYTQLVRRYRTATSA